jgi:hypothetical protein
MSVVAPQSIKNAVMAMYAGAALSLISIIVGLATKSSVMDDFRRQLVQDGNTPKEVDDAVSVASGVLNGSIIGLGIIGTLLWIWMAFANGKGKGWARIVATVLFALNTIGTIGSFFGSPKPSAFGQVLNILIWLAGLAAIYFLYRRESSDYINRATT